MTKLRERRIICDGKQFYISPKNTKYLEEGNKRFRGVLNTQPILELLDYSSPPTLNDLLGFKTKADFLEWLAIEAAKLTGRETVESRSFVLKKNKIVETLANEWSKNRDISIYKHPDYVYETICCSLYVTGEFKKDGRLGKNSGIDNMLRTLHILELNKSAISIIDIGSGLGLTTLYAAKYCPSSTVYYNDTSALSIELFKKLVSRSGLTNIVIVNDWKEKQNIEFDVVMCFELVEHIASDDDKTIGDPLAVVRSIRSQIKQGGHFLYSTMWNAEQNNGLTIGHFTTYKFNEIFVKLAAGKSDVRTKMPHKLFTKGMKALGFKARNGGGSTTEWDFKGHSPYCYTMHSK